jgi:hypothetical protein
VEASAPEDLWREWRQAVAEWDAVPDENDRAKNCLYDRRANIEGRLVAIDEGIALLASSINDVDEVVRLLRRPHSCPSLFPTPGEHLSACERMAQRKPR